MVCPVRFKTESNLTGKQRVRRGWFGKMILQVEFSYDSTFGMKTEYNVGTMWRDATEADLGIKFATINASNLNAT